MTQRPWQRPRRPQISRNRTSLAARRGGKRRWVAAWMVLLVAALAFWGSPGAVSAQLAIPRGGPTVSVSGTVSLPQDRQMERKLKFATDQMEAENYGEAVRLLGSILDSPEDFFFKPDPTGNNFVSIRQHVKRLLGKLPEAGRKAYQLRFGPQARRLLEAAVDQGDWQKLREVSGRFFHTDAGYQATMLLGNYLLDSGQPLAAALTFQRLRDAPARVRGAFEPVLSVKMATAWYLSGKSDQAERVLLALKKARPNDSLRIGDRTVGLFGAGTDPIRWLQTTVPVRLVQRAVQGRDHRMVRRDAARSGAGSSHNADLHFKWHARHYNNSNGSELEGQLPDESEDVDVGVEAAIENQVKVNRGQNLPTFAALRPLVVGELLLMRTATKLIAVDLRSGKRKWHVAEDRPMMRLIKSAAGNASNAARNQQKRFLDMALAQRIFADNTYGSLSSDGNLVFCVEDTNPVSNYYYGGRLAIPGRGTQKNYNRLRAYHLSKPDAYLMWEMGGQKGNSANPLPGAFFLGPPLPMGGRLYAIAETDGQIALHAVEQQKHTTSRGSPRYRAKPLWSQPLCRVEEAVGSDILRQTCGASPAYSDGIMVCPTGAGVVVAVDLTTRSLLWAYKYQRDEFPTLNNRRFRGRVPMLQPNAIQKGWTDSSVVLAEGKVLLTPRGSRSLHCLNLEDGSVAWTNARSDSLFVGGVHEGNVVIVGPNYVRAQNLDDGSPAWRTLPFPDGVKTAGRGFHHSGVYLLPLDNGYLATVEMKTGDLDIRDERVLPGGEGILGEGKLGNLVCVSGWVLSQDLTGVQGFRQVSLEALTLRVEKNPKDVEGLSQLGELLRQKGRLDEGLGYLRRAAELSPTVPNRRQLAKALLQGLDQDFAKYRRFAAELDQLTAGEGFADLRAPYLRALSEGYFALDQHREAFAALLKLSDFEAPDTQLHPLGESLSGRLDCCVAAQLAKYQATAPADVRAEIEDAIASRLNAAEATPEELRRGLRFFGSHPAADEARERLVGLLLEKKTPPGLEVEFLLRRLEQSSNADRSRAAVARLAEFYRTSADWPRKSQGLPAARHYYARLGGELADAVCLAGKTGRELYDAALESDEPFRKFLNPDPWPAGKVQVQSAAVPQKQPWTGVRTLDLGTSHVDDPASGHLRFQYQAGKLIAQTDTGRKLWQVSTHAWGQVARQSVSFGHRIAARGHLVVISTGYDIFGIDASPGITDDTKRVLWSHSLTKRSPDDTSRELYPTPRYEQTPWGRVKVRFFNPQGQPLGSQRPHVGPRQVTFLRGAGLISVDALSGQIIWQRGGLKLGSELFGDDQRVFVVDADGVTARVFRLADGTADGVRPVPHRSQRMATAGSRVLAWVPQGNGFDLKLVDVANGKTLWTRHVNQTAKATLIGTDEIGLYDFSDDDPLDEQFKVLSLADAKVRFMNSIPEVVNKPVAIYVLRSRESYVLAVDTSTSTTRRVGTFTVTRPAIPNYHDMPMVTGHVYGIERASGKRLWHLPAPGIGLPLLQPAESPVLMFLTSATGRNVINGRMLVRTFITSVAFVDKRRHAGGNRPRVIHKEAIRHNQITGGLPSYELMAGPGQKVQFKHPARDITLTFTAAAVGPGVKPRDLSLDLAALANQPVTGGSTPFKGIPVAPQPRR